MADPTSNIKKWLSFGWDAKSSAIIEMAKIITELGKTNSDYSSFAPEWFPAYGSSMNPLWGKMVDPDDIEPYVNAWVAWAAERRAIFTGPDAKKAMVEAGLDNTKSYVVANAMWRLREEGQLPLILESPSGWATTAGMDASDVGEFLDSLASNLKSGAMTGTSILRWTPWLIGAAAVVVAYPYVAPFITKALATRRATRGLA